MRNRIARNASSYNARGWRANPSPKSMPVIREVVFPYVNSAVPARKQPILPIKMPKMIGRVNRSPEGCLSFNFHLVISTPSKPPKSPPMIVLRLKKYMKSRLPKSTTGFSRNAAMRDPSSAPTAAPRMIDKRFEDVMGSGLFFLR